MIIVPLAKDEIETKDGAKLTVRGFTNYKPKGPALYANDGVSSPMVVVYFFDIDKINGVRVEYSQSSKVFTAMGKIKRAIHLPQSHDYIFVFEKKEEGVEPEKDSFSDSKKVKVAGYKLHSKKHGLAKGLLIEDEDKNMYRLMDILDVRREIGSDDFDRKKFLRLYAEYEGHK